MKLPGCAFAKVFDKQFKMAAQLVEFFIAGNLNSEEILKFVSSNDCSAICDQLQIPSVNSTEFIYELLMYLREQCSNVFEHAPRSYTVLSPRKVIFYYS